MHRDSERQKLFSRRAALLAGGKVVLFSALAGRMYYLQVIESERYATLAEDNRINLRLLAPPRGSIVDRFGKPIAVNQENYRVLLIPERTRDVEATLDSLGEILPIGENEKRRILREVRRKRGFMPVTLRENLSWDEVAKVEVNALELPGVIIDVGQSRFYPHGRETAHVIGYVAAVSERDLSGDPLLELPGFRIGKSGIEKVHDLSLRGKGGSSQVEVNAMGQVIRELSRRDGQPGADVALTIDIDLQKMVSRRLGDLSAAVTVLNVHSGEVLAMISTPSFDPNAFNKGLSNDEWKKLITNPRAPLTNKVIGGQYAPGSTFKMVVAMAALEKGVITPSSQVFCSGSIKLGDAVFHCWKRGGHGTVDLMKGISQSCDVYFYEVARRTGIERIGDMARRLGFGHKLGVDLPGEEDGLVPTREWKQATVGAPWQQGETLITGIGQGYLLATPLQLAVMMARLTNGGFSVTPNLTRNVSSQDSEPGGRRYQHESLGLKPEYLKVIRDAMAAVVNTPMGTAYRSHIEKPGFEMGGKTGTVQVRRITKAEREQGIRKNKDLPWKERDHAVFIGYAPVDAPRYAVAVLVEHGGGGSSVAAPIVRDILLEAQLRDAARPGVELRVTSAPGPRNRDPHPPSRGA